MDTNKARLYIGDRFIGYVENWSMTEQDPISYKLSIATRDDEIVFRADWHDGEQRHSFQRMCPRIIAELAIGGVVEFEIAALSRAVEERMERPARVALLSISGVQGWMCLHDRDALNVIRRSLAPRHGHE